MNLTENLWNGIRKKMDNHKSSNKAVLLSLQRERERLVGFNMKKLKILLVLFLFGIFL